MTDLHLISWNRPKMTELVIKTIHRNTGGDFRLIVLDNASDEPAVEMLTRLHEDGLIDEFIPIKTNLGLEAARDLLLREVTDTERFVCIDNDCLPPPGWLPAMHELMDKYEGYAAISQRTQVMIGTGNIFEDESLELTDFPHPGGSFRIMDTAAVRRVGGWQRPTGDKTYAPGRGTEERLICGKLREAGYKTAFATHIECLHLFGLKDVTDRWGYQPELKPEDSGHSDIWHPALANGDDPEAIRRYAGKKLTEEYFNVDRNPKT